MTREFKAPRVTVDDALKAMLRGEKVRVDLPNEDFYVYFIENEQICYEYDGRPIPAETIPTTCFSQGVWSIYS